MSHKIEQKIIDMMDGYLTTDEVNRFFTRYAVDDYIFFVAYLPFNMDIKFESKYQRVVAIHVFESIQKFILSQDIDLQPLIKQRIATNIRDFIHIRNRPSYNDWYQTTMRSMFGKIEHPYYNSDAIIDEIYYPSGFTKERTITWCSGRKINKKIWDENGTLLEEIQSVDAFILTQNHLFFEDHMILSQKKLIARVS